MFHFHPERRHIFTYPDGSRVELENVIERVYPISPAGERRYLLESDTTKVVTVPPGWGWEDVLLVHEQ